MADLIEKRADLVNKRAEATRKGPIWSDREQHFHRDRAGTSLKLPGPGRDRDQTGTGTYFFKTLKMIIKAIYQFQYWIIKLFHTKKLRKMWIFSSH